MKILIFLLLCPVSCFAAMSQDDCPEGTIWNSSTNKCYIDQNSQERIIQRQVNERLRQEREAEAAQAAQNAESRQELREYYREQERERNKSIFDYPLPFLPRH